MHCAVNQQGVVKVGAVDADQHKSLGGQYGVRGFPTIKVFGANKHKPEDYQGTDCISLLQFQPHPYNTLYPVHAHIFMVYRRIATWQQMSSFRMSLKHGL